MDQKFSNFEDPRNICQMCFRMDRNNNWSSSGFSVMVSVVPDLCK